MDVRASLNTAENTSVVAREGEKSLIENDSFYAKAPPLAASTVGRSKSRRFLEPDPSSLGSFLEDTPPARVTPPISEDSQVHFSFSSIDAGARPKVLTDPFRSQSLQDARSEGQLVDDWAVINAWCQDFKKNDTDTDGKSSLGVLNLEEMDLSSNHLLFDTPEGSPLIKNRNMESDVETTPQPRGTSMTIDSLRGISSDSNTLTSHEGSSNDHDSKPDQPFARSHSQIGGTVVKKASAPVKKVATGLEALGIRQSLFGQLPIGEECEVNTSVYDVQLEDGELNELDKDFGEMECSVAGDSEAEDEEKTPVKQDPCFAADYRDQGKLDSRYLRHGTTSIGDGEDISALKLTYLSKVSLFDENGNDFNSDVSELDTEDELEMVRRAQGTRHEAAGEAALSQSNTTRPGLEGGCSDESKVRDRGQLPITQRQSAEGDVVTSPVPGDGGGGGDGSSGSDSDSGRRNVHRYNRIGDRYQASIPTSRPHSQDQQEQRIRPMGDDLLSEMRSSRYRPGSAEQEDSKLQSRYLQPVTFADSTTSMTTNDNFNIDDFLSSQHSANATDQDFDPGDRLEASGFNADDLSGLGSNPFGGAMMSSFGSFGADVSQGQDASLGAGDDRWQELQASMATSAGSKQSSMGSQSHTSPHPVNRSTESLEMKPNESDEDHVKERKATPGSPAPQGGSREERTGTLSGSSGSTGVRKSAEKSENTDVFKKPIPPPPRTGMKLNASTASIKKPSPIPVGRVTASSEEEYVDLALRSSFSNQAAVQREGLKRVPSLGGTSQLDLTVHDDEFFGNDDALAMLDADEDEFNKENVLRQDEAMVDTTKENSNDSWMYRSVMSIARPSWMEDGSEEEKVRISVGSYMRGRTEALGSLDGDENVQRPEFGRPILSPTRQSKKLGEVEEEDENVFEQTRTSGVGDYSGGGQSTLKGPNSQKPQQEDPVLSKTQGESRLTLSLLESPAKSGNRLSAVNTNKSDTSIFAMNHVSMLLKCDSLEDLDPKQMTQRLVNLGLSKQNKHKDAETKTKAYSSCTAATTTTTVTSSVTTSTEPRGGNPTSPVSPRSRLPVKKGSSVNRSFPKVSDMQNSLLKSYPKKTDLDKEFDMMVKTHKKLTEKFEESSPSKSKQPEQVKPSSVDSKVNEGTQQARKSNEEVKLPSRSSPKWTSPNKSTFLDTSCTGFRDNNDLSFVVSSTSRASGIPKLNFDIGEIRNNQKPESVPGASSASAGVSRTGPNLTLPSFSQPQIVDDERETPPADGQATPVESLAPNQFPSVSVNQGNVRGNDSQAHRQFKQPKDSATDPSYTSSFAGKSENFNQSQQSKLVNVRTIGDAVPKSIPCSVGRNEMAGHHIPDGTEYSQRSDYAHMDHKGMSRADLVGTSDIGLAESRGFDAIKGRQPDRNVNGELHRSEYTKGTSYRSSELHSLDASALRTQNQTSSASHNSQYSASSLSLQPVQSTSPVSRGVGTSHSHGPGSQLAPIPSNTSPEPGSQRSMETQTNGHRQESWTQTSMVLRKSVGLQQEDSGNCSRPNQQVPASHHNAIDQSHDSSRHVPTCTSASSRTGLPPPLTSFKHNLLPERPTEPETPHLLSKESLLNTDFAQDYLKRDVSLEVLEKIHASKLIPSSVPVTSASIQRVPRESLESVADWTLLKDNTTMETTHDFNKLTDQTRLDPSHQSHWAPSNHSTPFAKEFPAQMNMSKFSTTVLTPSSMHTLSSTGYQQPAHAATDGDLSSRLPEHRHGVSQPLLCPVEVPSKLSFADVCCVGISKKEVLTLKNPTDTWLECLLQVTSVKIDGLNASVDCFPFDMQKKVIIGPLKTEGLNVIFLPKHPGVYVAEVQVISQLFLRQQKKDSGMNARPTCINFHAVAEEPKVKVSVDDGTAGVINFGDLTWGTCREKSIKLVNCGHAMVPLRLVITSNRAWHCFAFEPEGRTSDVSIISGRQMPAQTHGKSIINLSLSGSEDRFNFHEIKVWCRPPDKNIDRALTQLPPEEFSCRIDIELDIPYSRFPTLNSLQLKARVGVHKLHIQAGLKELRLKECAGKTATVGLGIYNAGNLNLELAFAFTDHRDILTVTPDQLNLPPRMDTELKIKCNFPPNASPQAYTALLLLVIQSDGGMYELGVVAEVIPYPRPALTQPNILCDYSKMDFGGVALGKQFVKRYQLINKGSEALVMKSEVRADGFMFVKGPDPLYAGQKNQEIYLEPNKTTPVYVMFTPSTISRHSGKIVMRPHSSDRKYTVHLEGYGGVSKVVVNSYSQTVQMRNRPCVFLESMARSRVKQLVLHNVGARSANVSVTCYTDFDSDQRHLPKNILVQPCDFSIKENEKKSVDIVLGLSERELPAHVKDGGLVSLIKFSYQDKADSSRPYRSSLEVGVLQSLQDASRSSLSSVSDSYATPATSFRHNSTTFVPPLAPVPQYKSDTYSRGVEEVMKERASVGSIGWHIIPDQITLSSSTYDSRENQFYIYNNQERDLSFEITWPGGMFSVSPDRGVVKARQNKVVHMRPLEHVFQEVDKLPWSGTIFITCGDAIKTMKVHIQRESHPQPPVVQKDYPEVNPTLIPVTAPVPQPQSSPNRLGDLEVSRSVVLFPSTHVSKTSEELIILKNTGGEMLRWMFSSFAAPYLRKTADNSKEMFRVSYKVFDFSHQFGKLSGHSTTQLILKFMPRSTGTFTQYWDVQTTGHSSSTSHSDSNIRIQLTGEGTEESDPRVCKPSFLDSMTSVRPESQRLGLKQEVLTFPTTTSGSGELMKTELKNMYPEDILVEVTAPKPPFYIKHQKVEVAKKRYLRYPVEFRPKLPGKYIDVVKFQGSKGDDLLLRVEGECV